MSPWEFYSRKTVAKCRSSSTPVVVIPLKFAEKTCSLHHLLTNRQELACHPVWWWSLPTWTSARCLPRLQSRRWLGLSCHPSFVKRAGWRCSGKGWTGRTAAADAAPSERARWLRRRVTNGNIFKTQKEINSISGLTSDVLDKSLVISEVSQSVFSPLARSSSSFLFVEVEGSLATKAGLAFACSAAFKKKKRKKDKHTIYNLMVPTRHGKAFRKSDAVTHLLLRLYQEWNSLNLPGSPQLGRWRPARVGSWS